MIQRQASRLGIAVLVGIASTATGQSLIQYPPNAEESLAELFGGAGAMAVIDDDSEPVREVDDELVQGTASAEASFEGTSASAYAGGQASVIMNTGGSSIILQTSSMCNVEAQATCGDESIRIAEAGASLDGHATGSCTFELLHRVKARISVHYLFTPVDNSIGDNDDEIAITQVDAYLQWSLTGSSSPLSNAYSLDKDSPAPTSEYHRPILNPGTYTVTAGSFQRSTADAYFIPSTAYMGALNAQASAGANAGCTVNLHVFCLADQDEDGGVTTDDLLQFLTDFRNLDPAADFNGDGDVTVDDINEFLAAFRTPCP